MTVLDALARTARSVSAGTGRVTLFWKLLLPGLVVTLIAAPLVLFVGVRYVAEDARDRLDVMLNRRTIGVEALLQEQTLHLSEAAATAANLVGVPEAVVAGDATSLQQATAGLLGVRSEVSLAVVTGVDGTGLADVRRREGGINVGGGSSWADRPAVAQALSTETVEAGGPTVEVADVEGVSFLVAVAPVRQGTATVGAALAGVELDVVLRTAAEREGADVALFDEAGRLIAGAGSPPPPVPEGLRSDRPVRVRSGSPAVSTLYDVDTLSEGLAVTVALTLPESSAGGSLSGRAFSMAAIVLAAVAGLLGVSGLVARRVARRLGELANTSRALGAGDLSARASDAGHDEISELAERFNAMAEEIEAAHQEFERRVEARTAELRRLYAESTSARERQAESFAHVSHEFRNPLFAIMSHAELMLDPEISPDAPEWVAEYASTIRAAAEELLDHVNGVLEATRQETSPMVMDVAPLSLAEELGALEGTIQALARRGGVNVEIHVASSLPRVEADRRFFGDIILNLVSNAVKYTPAGGDVRVTAAARDGRVELVVADTGVGIPPGAIDHVFEPFYRVEGIQVQAGQASTGLGLALTKRNVEAHGGDIAIESTVGRGTLVTVSLPGVGAKAKSSGRRGRGVANPR